MVEVTSPATRRGGGIEDGYLRIEISKKVTS